MVTRTATTNSQGEQEQAKHYSRSLNLLPSGLYRRRRTFTELLPCGSRAYQVASYSFDVSTPRIFRASCVPQGSVCRPHRIAQIKQSSWFTVGRELGLQPSPCPEGMLCNCDTYYDRSFPRPSSSGMYTPLPSFGSEGFHLLHAQISVRSGVHSIASTGLAASRAEASWGSSWISRKWGKRITSRIVSRFVSSIIKRSIPMPKPPVGGIP